ncbi:MAG: glycine--tRNA ligase [Bacteroidota bacterium]
MDVMEKVVSLCKRRGFIFQSSEIYGGLSSTWDYGPLGVLLKNNVKQAWWKSVVQERPDMVGLDAAILMAPDTWKASGHIANFTDPMVDCLKCKQRFRADHVEGDKCPSCGGELTEARLFNLMFKTFMGPVEDTASTVFLRPETAQGIFVNYKNVLTALRKKPPFGIAQIGKSFRNEITPGNFTFRTREFEQMEIEFFCPPALSEQYYKDWVQSRYNWYLEHGMKKENLRLRPHGEDELAHYARGCEDIEYLFPFGWSELEGIANRTDFDLKAHAECSGKDLTYFDEETKERYYPFVIEPSAGADRGTLAFLVDAYDEETDEKGETRVVLRFHPSLAPIKVAVLPLSKKPELKGPSQAIYAELRKRWMVDYDETGSIGKRYRRQDEVGTPFCVTIDFDSLEDKAVTVRERDSMSQVRLPIDQLIPYLEEKLGTPHEALTQAVFG